MEEKIEDILRGGQFKQLVEKQFAELKKKYDLKRIELDVLFYLSKCGENNTSVEICHHLRVNKGHISQTVDNLCRMKYLKALPDKEDRRYVHYVLEDSAVEIVDTVSRKWQKLTDELFAGITKEELETFKEVSGKIVSNMTRILSQ